MDKIMSNLPSEITLLDYLQGNLTDKKGEEVYNPLLNCRDRLEALANKKLEYNR